MHATVVVVSLLVVLPSDPFTTLGTPRHCWSFLHFTSPKYCSYLLLTLYIIRIFSSWKNTIFRFVLKKYTRPKDGYISRKTLCTGEEHAILSAISQFKSQRRCHFPHCDSCRQKFLRNLPICISRLDIVDNTRPQLPSLTSPNLADALIDLPSVPHCSFPSILFFTIHF